MDRINSILFIFLILISNTNSSPAKRQLEYSLTFDSTNWSYDSTNKVYYQIKVFYCTKPASETHESLGIYVPEEYMTCTESSSKYKCSINSSGKKGSYNATNAPYVMPVNTAGYSANAAPTSYSYSGVSTFLSKGLIYVHAGCRGRFEGGESYHAGAPWGVTDLKAAIRFLRYNAASLPGDLKRFYTFGHSGGGAQSCLMGVTGNSDLFNDYLNDIGAAMTDADGSQIKDNIKGSQCWCPITNLDTADAAYEWNMGQYYSTGTRASGTFTKSLSDDLTAKYVEYVNNLKLKDPKGNLLTLTATNTGTYYDYLKSVIEESLNNFIKDTTFPYDPSSSNNNGGGGGPGGNGGGPNGSPPSDMGGEGGKGGSPPSDMEGPPNQKSLRNLATYETAQAYIDSLNSDKTWITLDSTTNNYMITSVGDFITHCKSASKTVGAFDALNKNQAENKLFGIDGTTYTKHFDSIMAGLLTEKSSTYSTLTNWESSYPTDYTSDLDVKDYLGKTIKERVDIYNPMFYLNSYYKGYGTSEVADYFRINTGITQSDTSNVVEMNLYLALLNYGKNAEFTTVWNQGHTEAERTGSADCNFISWIAKIEGVEDDGVCESATKSNGGGNGENGGRGENGSDGENDGNDESSSNSILLKLNYFVISFWLLFLL